jgi:hypothetical protein
MYQIKQLISDILGTKINSVLLYNFPKISSVNPPPTPNQSRSPREDLRSLEITELPQGNF